MLATFSKTKHSGQVIVIGCFGGHFRAEAGKHLNCLDFKFFGHFNALFSFFGHFIS